MKIDKSDLNVFTNFFLIGIPKIGAVAFILGAGSLIFKSRLDLEDIGGFFIIGVIFYVFAIFSEKFFISKLEKKILKRTINEDEIINSYFGKLKNNIEDRTIHLKAIRFYTIKSSLFIELMTRRIMHIETNSNDIKLPVKSYDIPIIIKYLKGLNPNVLVD